MIYNCILIDSFSLVVVQQPGSVEANCFRMYRSNKACMNPCPIFQLVRRNDDGTPHITTSDYEELRLFMAHAIVISQTGQDLTWVDIESLEHDAKDRIYLQQLQSRRKEQLNDGRVPAKTEGLLCGKLVSSCHILTDLQKQPGAYFIFEDLSVNIEGIYKLKISVTDLSMYSQYF